MLPALRLILAGLFLLSFSGFAPAAEKPETGGDDAVLWFVSFSMPEASLRQAVDQAEKAGAVLVLRGLKGNSFKDTVKAISSLIREKNVQVQIDPTLFKKYDITAVPCVCYRDWKVCGDVTLEYAMDLIAEKEPSAKKYLKKLRSSYYAP